MGKLASWVIRMAFVGLGTVVLALSAPVTLADAGDHLAIVKWLKLKVSLYDSPDGGSKNKVASKDLPLNVDVKEIAPNKRMRIIIKNETFWVSPRHAKTNKKFEIKSNCAVVAMVDTTAARGAADGC